MAGVVSSTMPAIGSRVNGYLHLTVLPPMSAQLGFAGDAAGKVASPHWPVEAFGVSITIVPVSGRLAVFTG